MEGPLAVDGLDGAGGFDAWSLRSNEHSHHPHGGVKLSYMMTHTSFDAMKMMKGGAIAGGLMYLHCKAKCPGGSGTGKGLIGAAIGMGGQLFQEAGSAIKGVAGMFMGQDDRPYGTKPDGQPMDEQELVTSIHKRACSCNCKVDSLMAAAAGAALAHAVTKGLEAPLDEWTTAPFFAATLNKDGYDSLGFAFKDSADSQAGEDSRNRDVSRDLNREFYEEFLCLEDAVTGPKALAHDGQCFPSSYLQSQFDAERESRSTFRENQSSETPAKWMSFFKLEKISLLDDITQEKLS